MYADLGFMELTRQQLYALLKLRQEVFVVEQECWYLDCDGLDPDARHLLCRLDDALIGYARILPPGTQYDDYVAIGRICTAMSQRNKGYGKEIVRRSIEVARLHHPGIPIRISAQTYLLTFYGSFGFRPVGPSYLEDGIPHRAMILDAGD